MRNAFAQCMTEVAGEDPKVFLMMADIGNRLFNDFQARHGERFLNCGIAEANMISMASGLASGGFKPVCYTIAPFVTARCYEQIRVDVGYHESNVVIVGTGSGLSYASLGATHHGFDDIAIMRAIPGIDIFAPCDANDVHGCLRAALASPRPAYIRIGKKREPQMLAEIPKVEIGKFAPYRPGTDVCILNCGTTLPACVTAAEALEANGISSAVVQCSSTKPLDTEFLREAFSSYQLVLTVEEHSLIGGLGSAVAEFIVDEDLRTGAPLLRLGIPDEFIHQTGSQEYARKKCGLDADSIANSVIARLRKEA